MRESGELGRTDLSEDMFVYALILCDVDFPWQMERASPSLPPSILAAVLARRSLRARQSRLFSHVLSTCAVAWFSRGTCSEDDIVRTDIGQPVISDGSLYLSLAHSGDVIVCAVGRRKVGIDIERMRPKLKRVARRYFSMIERFLTRLPAVGDLMFLKLWTRKEAFLKMLGVGVSGLHGTRVTTIPPVSALGEGTAISFLGVKTFPGYICSLCVTAKKPRVKVWAIDSRELLNAYVKLSRSS